jgi:hypothetical protein
MFEVHYSILRGEPLHFFLPSSYVEASVSPELMLRPVNAEGALSLLQSRSGLRSYSKAKMRSQNAGSCTVGGSNGQVARGARAEERVTLDVRQHA